MNLVINGNLDVKSYSKIAERSWVFRSVGYGHGREWRHDFGAGVRMVGYDYVLSIEHEDGMMRNREGLEKALQTIKIAVVREHPAPSSGLATDRVFYRTAAPVSNAVRLLLVSGNELDDGLFMAVH